MSETPATIETREQFGDRLTDLVDAAEADDVDVRGAYDIETARDGARYDVEVTALHTDRV